MNKILAFILSFAMFFSFSALFSGCKEESTNRNSYIKGDEDDEEDENEDEDENDIENESGKENPTTEPITEIPDEIKLQNAEQALIDYFEAYYDGNAEKLEGLAPQEFRQVFDSTSPYPYDTVKNMLPYFSENEITYLSDRCGSDLKRLMVISESYLVTDELDGYDMEAFIESYNLDADKITDIAYFVYDYQVEGSKDSYIVPYSHYVLCYDNVWYPMSEYYYDYPKLSLNFLAVDVMNSLVSSLEFTPNAIDAIEWLKLQYQDDGAQTAIDYTRYGIIHIGSVTFTIVWSAEFGEEVENPEDLLKIDVLEEGAAVKIDINEECEEDTPYVLTATITDLKGNVSSFSWNYIMPKGADMVAIAEEAYALAPGESMDRQVRLRGKIISIDAVYDAIFKNITVTIEVEGAEGKPIKCYRLKGEGAEDLLVGNIITVSGLIKNYEGIIEFDAGCILEAVEKGDAVEAPTDAGEILKAAYALAENAALPYPVTLTGTVTGIDSPYDPNYSNISVVITVEGYEQYPILCYRLKGEGVDQIALKDLITVTGIIKNYKGTIEFDSGCQMIDRVSGDVAEGPSSDPKKILNDAAKS